MSIFVSTIIVKSLDPLRAKKTFIRKKLGHTMVSAIKASSATIQPQSLKLPMGYH